ncbi:unnamed protein product [Blepharisma stoltei]|uniref:Transmembrane protein n=1 Tax=Blepharisma stoltei TaxID=1481888 RepID=A0AAU9JLB7_9CILI|nr:unnamed protein product [Blepharisma stoltei]
MDLLTSQLLKQKPPKSLRRKCFYYRILLGNSNRTILVFQTGLGLFVFLHPIISFAIVTISEGYDKYELALLPLICVGAEVVTFSSVMFVIVICDVIKQKQGFSVWHRSAVGRLIQNAVIGMLWLSSMILSIIYIETTEDQFFLHSFMIITMPITILLIMAIVKFIFIHIERLAFWLSASLLWLIQIVILIVKEDYKVYIPWYISLMPIILNFLLLGFCSLILFNSRKKARDVWGEIATLLSCAGSVSAGLCIFALSCYLDGIIEEWKFFVFDGWVALLMLCCAYCRKIGSWVMDIAFGHVEVDYIHFEKPVKMQSLVRCRSV